MSRRRLPSDLGPRIAVAVPAALVLLGLNHVGGWALAVPFAVLGALGQAELARMAALSRAATAPGCLAAAAVPLVALLAGGEGLVIALAAALVVAPAAAFALARGRATIDAEALEPRRGPATAGLAPGPRRRAAALVTAGGVLWLGLGLGHAVLLRELPEGASLVIAVLLAVFLGDTAAQLVGTAFGRRRLAPRISPNKTIEGTAAGLVVGTAACWAFAAFALDTLSGGEALALGLACAIAAPLGDLLESAVKRRAGVKDSGRLFGAHGGVLDRIDAALAAAVVGYHVVRLVT